ncbi:MAG TPA: hypothetical protein VLK82_10070 [Candidatus Tectomicrobia bacterium]|nr:hypothetical protein [Candidatus Tectomicrobia bacterium]
MLQALTELCRTPRIFVGVLTSSAHRQPPFLNRLRSFSLGKGTRAFDARLVFRYWLLAQIATLVTQCRQRWIAPPTTSSRNQTAATLDF